MPSSSSTSSDGKSSTRNTTSPASLRNPSGSDRNAASASAARSSSDGAFPNASLIGHDDVRRVGRADLEKADVQRLLRLDGAQRRAGDGLEGVGVRRLAGAAGLAGLR